MKRFSLRAATLLLAAFGIAGLAFAADAPVRTIHLDQYNGYFSAQETLSGLQPGETQSAIVEVTTEGVRYRCPINPTPWYDLDAIKPAG